MSGINWKYNDGSKSRIYWSISSENYLYLGQLFMDFDFKFDQSLEEHTAEFELTKKQIEFLVDGIETRLDKLIEKFNPEVPNGLKTISNEYNGKKYNFYIKMSRNHQLIYSLIEFYKFLTNSTTNNKSIIFWGGKI